MRYIPFCLIIAVVLITGSFLSKRPEEIKLGAAIYDKHSVATRMSKGALDDREAAEILLNAASQGDFELAELIVTKFERIDLEFQGDYGTTALLNAVENGNSDLAILLLRRGASPLKPNAFGINPLILASRKGDLSVVNEITKDDIGLDGRYPVQTGIHSGKLNISAIEGAVIEGRPKILELLLAKGASRDIETTSGDSLRTIAIRNGHTGLVSTLDSRFD